MEKLIKKGAEADIYLGEWFGERAVFKIRKPKAFRHPKLDEEIRRLRTLREARFLADARAAGVPTPLVYFVDPERGEIVMQHVEGERLKDALSDGDVRRVKALSANLGSSLGRLHADHIVHGDLSTSNFIVTEGDRLTFLDFGLAFHSQRLEDKAVDIHLIREILTSAHGEVSGTVFQHILHGYEETVGAGLLKKLLVKIREIEARGRYARVV